MARTGRMQRDRAHGKRVNVKRPDVRGAKTDRVTTHPATAFPTATAAADLREFGRAAALTVQAARAPCRCAKADAAARWDRPWIAAAVSAPACSAPALRQRAWNRFPTAQRRPALPDAPERSSPRQRVFQARALAEARPAPAPAPAPLPPWPLQRFPGELQSLRAGASATVRQPAHQSSWSASFFQ